jgi:hypothetical protein
MLLIPEDLGNAVKIKDRIVPAVNIQTEITPDYTLYFEILFEDGGLWICYFEHHDPNAIYVEMFRDYAHERTSVCQAGYAKWKPDVNARITSWNEFLMVYEDWVACNPGVLDEMW